MTPREYALRLPPDVLMHPMPFPSRLDYAEKIIKEAQREAVLENNKKRTLTPKQIRDIGHAIRTVQICPYREPEKFVREVQRELKQSGLVIQPIKNPDF